jgi:hypothetical protein
MRGGQMSQESEDCGFPHVLWHETFREEGKDQGFRAWKNPQSML